MLPIDHEIDVLEDNTKVNFNDVLHSLYGHLCSISEEGYKPIFKGLTLIDYTIERTVKNKTFIDCEFTYSDHYPYKSDRIQETSFSMKL